MIDLIITKLAMMVAAVIILGTVLGVYAIQRDQGKDLELLNIAEAISRAVDDLNSIQGDTILNITFDSDAEGRYLEPMVDGRNYDILITRWAVAVSQDHRWYGEDFIAPVHLWKPEKNSFTSSEIEKSDMEQKELAFTSGIDFTIERMRVVVGEEGRFLTFLYF